MRFFKKYINLYTKMFLIFFWPKKYIAIITNSDPEADKDNILRLMKNFRFSYLEAIFATMVAMIIGYLLAGCPLIFPINKLVPTLLISFPVYGTKRNELGTWSGDTDTELMDVLFFKTIYLIGITWLVWGIFAEVI